jgi:hypothetical protein
MIEIDKIYYLNPKDRNKIMGHVDVLDTGGNVVHQLPRNAVAKIPIYISAKEVRRAVNRELAWMEQLRDKRVTLAEAIDAFQEFVSSLRLITEEHNWYSRDFYMPALYSGSVGEHNLFKDLFMQWKIVKFLPGPDSKERRKIILCILNEKRQRVGKVGT